MRCKEGFEVPGREVLPTFEDSVIGIRTAAILSGVHIVPDHPVRGGLSETLPHAPTLSTLLLIMCFDRGKETINFHLLIL